MATSDTAAFIWLESWKSSANEEEIHYFLLDTDTYVAGFNPARINREVFESRLAELGYAVKGVRHRVPQ